MPAGVSMGGTVKRSARVHPCRNLVCALEGLSAKTTGEAPDDSGLSCLHKSQDFINLVAAGKAELQTCPISFFNLTRRPVRGVLVDRKSLGTKPTNEGHGFSRAVNRRYVTALAAAVRFFETYRAKSSLARLSLSSTQLQDTMPINTTQPDFVRPRFKSSQPLKT